MRRFFAIATSIFIAISAMAQSQRPVVEAHISPDSIMIGDRFDLVIDVERDQVQVVLFPAFEVGKSDMVELVREHPVDTIKRDGRHLRLRKRYTLQAFQEGQLHLGRASVLYADKNITDTLYSRDSLVVEVGTYLIDSTSLPVMALKPQKTLPLKFGEVSGYIGWSLVGILLLALAVYIFVRVMHHFGRNVGDLFRPASPVPPHVAAIGALEELHHKKLWQNGKYKLYYSTLTDILRTYIAARYGIGAMEMTSDEIIVAMRSVELPQKSAMDLTSILQEADLVKFAKAEPEAEINEQLYTAAYYFVEETKEQEVESGESDEMSVKIEQ